MDQLRIVRRQRKAAITRHLGTLERLVAEEDVDGVRERLERVRNSFEEFESSHDEYTDALDVESKSKDSVLSENETWFIEVQREYIVKVKEARDWLKSLNCSNWNNDIASDQNVTRSELTNLLNIPKVELDKFDGDPLEYQTFIAIFDETVDSKINDGQVKLTRLLQYTSGSAKSSIKNCALIGGDVGYKQARDILKSRFGNSHLVSQRIITDLKNGKRVSKADELRLLADELDMAVIALQKLNMYAEVNTQQSILDILQRCPNYVRNRWRKKALDTKGDTDLYPSFGGFVEFMKLVSSEACDPVYGMDTSKTSDNAKNAHCNTVMGWPLKDKYSTVGSSDSVDGSSNSSSLQSSSKQGNQRSYGPCVVCGQFHRLFYCDAFKAMSPNIRLDVVMKNKLCFNCLLAGHGSRDCRKQSVCSVAGCGRKHTKFIHIYRDVNPGTSSGVAPVESTASNGHVISGNLNVGSANLSVYLPMVPVCINGKCEVYALLDTGSTTTFITQRLATSLNLQGRNVSYVMNTLSQSANANSKIVSINLSSVGEGKPVKIDNVFVVPSIPARYPCHMIDLEMYPHLSGLPLRKVKGNIHADILIGMDNAHVLMPYEVRSNPDDLRQPYAIRTLFGWSLNGPVDIISPCDVTSHFVDLDQRIDRLWEMERMDEDISGFSKEDQRVLDLWNREVGFENGHFSLPVPWHEGKPHFPNNKYMAVARLRNLQRKLIKGNMFDVYSANLKKMIEDGYAELVPEEELLLSDGTVWYLPHHAVFSDAKPGKLRIVFDCAATCFGVSLNNQCFQGPDLNNKLLHVLLRFRQFNFAVMADVEAMYHQVKIPTRDRNSLRFLWHEGGTFQEYRMTSHLFGGVWCASSSTFALRKSVEDLHTSELIRETVCRSFYVDDMLKSLKSREEALEVIHGTKYAIRNSGFNLTKFVVNDALLLEGIDVDDRAKEVKEVASDMQSKVLGIRWDVQGDSFYYLSKHTVTSEKVTKRMVLSQLSSVYDPLGLLSPLVLRGRMLFQESSRLKLSWEEELPQELACRWSRWLMSLKSVSCVRFQRCVFPEGFCDGVMELHTFCDASEGGYGACSYVRIINKKGAIHVALLASKVRLAPLKQVTIPRLELSAAVVAINLACVIERELDVTFIRSSFWTDSQIVLAYICSESRRFKTFVANRVSLIRARSIPDQWSYVKSCENPADVLSRGCGVDAFPSIWFHGPPFLKEYKCSWHKESFAKLQVLDDDVEMKRDSTVGNGTMCGNVDTVVSGCDFVHPLEALMGYFSCYYRLKKAICWILRTKYFLRNNTSVKSDHITVQEMKFAQSLLVKYVQGEVYEDEITALGQGQCVAKSSSLYKLSPVFVDGFLLVGGRLNHAIISPESRHPMILPRDHRLSYLIVHYHHNVCHLGTEWTLSNIRKEFWIVRARSLIKWVSRNCIVCKKLYASPMSQKMSDLPPERCTPGRPAFGYVGVDLFGPFYVKVGRAEAKRYGCLYTCFNTRAIHIEVLHSLQSDDFINGFIRFTARRGYPEKVWSDNGTNFVGGQAELSRSIRQLNQGKVVDAARRKNVEWIFNSPHASHHGGVWERMIRTVRRILVTLINVNNKMKDDVLSTVFCEVENIVNGRPITKCSDDVNDDSPLTPNHLLLLKSNSALPWGAIHESDVYRRRWRHVQHIATIFWNRWLREYLPDLQRRQKWNDEQRNLKVGDLVLVMNEQSPRGSWPLGLVIETKIGRDGFIRSATIKTKMARYVRPITKLVLLEGTSFV